MRAENLQSAIDAMEAAGVDPAQIVAVVKFMVAEGEAGRAVRRLGDRERQARRRAKAQKAPDNIVEVVTNEPDSQLGRSVRNVTRDSGENADVMRDERDERDTLSLAPSPQTPQPHTHTREDTTSRAREAGDWPDGDAHVHARLLAALNSRIDLDAPNLGTTIGEIVRWRVLGFSWELDVVPVVRGQARPNASAIRSWTYFSDAIAEANASRTRPSVTPLIKVQKDGSSRSADEKFQRRQRNLVVAASVRPAVRGDHGG